MKRTALILAAIFTFILFSNSTYAQSTGSPGSQGVRGTNWVDANGDGICDNYGTANQGSLQNGNGYGKKDGTGNPVRPQDGTGYGKKSGNATGTGVCDGTGPKGNTKRGGRK